MTQSASYRIRASSFGELFDCAHRWEGKYLLGMTMPNSPRALIGTGVHAATAVFDQSRIDGGSPISVDDAAGVAVDAIKERIKLEGARWTTEDPSEKEVNAIAIGVTARYCERVSPNYEFEAVELTTVPLAITCHNGIVIELTGTLDRARVRAGSHGISDVKTGRNAVVHGRASTKRHRAQIGTYELLYENTTGNRITAPGEIIGLSTGKGFETGTADVVGAKRLLLGDGPGARFQGLIEDASLYFAADRFPGNPQSTLCDARYCPRYGRCAYQEM